MFNSKLLKGRWLYFIISLTCVLVIMITSGCGETHKTYDYGNFTKQLSATAMQPGDEFFTFHPGEQFTLKWTPVAAQDTTASSPSPVKILAELRGPFATLEDMKKAMAAKDGVKEPVVASMQPFQTDDWTNKPYQYDFLLNSHLAPGYYVLIQTVNSAQASNSFRSEIRIAA